MNRADFISGLGRALEWPGEIFNGATELRGHENWDSAGVMSAMLFIDEGLGKAVTAKSLESVRTVDDIVGLVADSLE